MPQMFMSLHRHSLALDDKFTTPSHHQAVWVESGSLDISGNSVSAGEGHHAAPHDIISATTSTKFIRFDVNETEDNANVSGQSELILRSKLTLGDGPVFMRLDQVTFPANACAYRHVHPGPGIRYLTCGALEIKSDSHTEMMHPEQAWFEDTDSPVQATSQNADTTAFVRAMVLPLEYEGKKTIKLLNSEDFSKPALQTYERFFEARIAI